MPWLTASTLCMWLRKDSMKSCNASWKSAYCNYCLLQLLLTKKGQAAIAYQQLVFCHSNGHSNILVFSHVSFQPVTNFPLSRGSRVKQYITLQYYENKFCRCLFHIVIVVICWITIFMTAVVGMPVGSSSQDNCWQLFIWLLLCCVCLFYYFFLFAANLPLLLL